MSSKFDSVGGYKDQCSFVLLVVLFILLILVGTHFENRHYDYYGYC